VSKASNEASYRPSAYYWRKDIRAEREAGRLVGFIRDLGEELAAHNAALVRLGTLPQDDGEITEASLTTKGTRAALQRAALRLVLALEQRKAQIRELGCIPPKSRMAPSEQGAKPHLLG
jgi:hypothetical protein